MLEGDEGMNIAQILAQAQNGEGMGALARALGMDERQVSAIASQLAPMPAGAAKTRLASDDPEPVLAALEGERDARYVDDAAAAANARDEGEAFLENMFGSRDATAAVKQRVAEKAGVDLSDVLAVLPSLAAIAKGGMQRQTPDDAIASVRTARGGASGGGMLGGLIGTLTGGGKAQGGQGGAADLLTRMFDEDGDGSAIDDIMGKFLK
jgi:hypothetical protein